MARCRECSTCGLLRQELAELRRKSEERARQDHDQCVAMFQQMQELVRMNKSGARVCKSFRGHELEDDIDDNGAVARPLGGALKQRSATDSESGQLQRLQAIIVQQAKELELLRRRQRDELTSGCIRPSTTRVKFTGNQSEEDEALHNAALCEGSDASDSGEYEGGNARVSSRSVMMRHVSHLRKLPLTSLHAKIKGKELQVKHLQQLIAKLETRFEQLVDRKRSMAQSYQQTAKVQQAHLKKYLAYIEQQALEKRALERKVRDLNQYITVLEKNLVSCTAAA